MSGIRNTLEYLPRYLTDFGSLALRPKRFIANRNPKADDTYHGSLVFLGVSVFLFVVMTVPLRPTEVDFHLYLGGQIATSLLAVSLYAIALRLAWRLVGGKATVRSFFATYAYFFGVISIITTLFLLIGEGILKIFEPEIYAKIRSLQRETEQVLLPLETLRKIPGFIDSSIPAISVGILAAGYCVSGVWLLLAWGAFRQLNGSSKLRSFIAMMIMGPLGWVVAIVVSFVSQAIEP